MTRQSKACSLSFIGLWWLLCLKGVAQPESSAAPASYEQLIATLQSSQNESATGLSEAYLGLGNSLQTLERHDDAVGAFGQALQLLREDKGLYALDQIPLLQARLISNQALQAWQDVDADRHLAYRIALKNPAAGVDLHYQTLRELGLWKLKAAEEALLQDPLEQTSEAAALYREELGQADIGILYKGKALSLANLYLDLAALEFLQARKKLALPLSAYVEGGQRQTNEMFCETLPTADGRGRQVCRNIQVPNMDYFMALSDRKYAATWEHLEAMQEAVLEAWEVLLPEVETQNRDDALALLSEVHRLTDAFNDFVAKNARKRADTRIAAPTGSRINH